MGAMQNQDGTGPKRRVTIADVATSAGVSTGAVSLAVNGRAGVSEQTRSRILDVAADLGWAPSSAARSLMGARTETVGLAIARGPYALPTDSFFTRFIGGVESELAKRSYSLLLQMVPDVGAEVRSHQQWRASRKVDGLMLVDLRDDDPRVSALREGVPLPAVLSGDPRFSAGFPSVWTDDAGAMEDVIAFLVSLGHRRIARVGGLSVLGHTHVRDEAFLRHVRRLGVGGRIFSTDYSPASTRAATIEALSGAVRPTAVLFDNDLMALGGLTTIREMGLQVPEDVSIVAWDDSPVTQLTHPPLTAVGHDVVEHGAAAARVLFAAMDGKAAESHLVARPSVIVRGSTAPLPPS